MSNDVIMLMMYLINFTNEEFQQFWYCFACLYVCVRESVCVVVVVVVVVVVFYCRHNTI